jgi:hypothetical protein
LFEQRFRRKLRSWPPGVASDVVAYMGRSRPGDGANDSGERLWSLLPRWLLDDRRFAAAAHRRPGWIDDILWAQYCLFLFVRIHDDLFDGQAQQRSLVFVADEMLLEAQNTLARRSTAARFWQLFRQNVALTLRGILRADAIQQRRGAMNGRTVTAYADVSAVFKVAIAAVCVGSGRMREFRALSRFADEIAIAEQILDDLFDVDEDLARSRYNFAANCLLIGQLSEGIDAERITRELLLGQGVGAVFQKVRRHLDRAADAVAPLRLAPAIRYVDAFRRGVDDLRQQLHATRAAYVFEDLRASG